MQYKQPKQQSTQLYYRSYRPSVVTRSKIKAPRHHRFLTGLSILILACSVYVGVTATQDHLRALAKQNKPSLIYDSELASHINSILAKNSQYQIGIALTDIDDNKTQTFGDTSPFVAASTAKILAACAYYHLVETGQASLSDSMGDYDASFQLEEMVNDSDNDAWALIVAAIGDGQLQAYANSIGVTYDETNNTLSPAAMAMVLTKLYKGELLNKGDTAQLLSYMQNTNDEDLIPAAVPSSVTVYHKYGLLDDELHDASILVRNGHAYSFVVYTKDASGYSDADPRIGTIHDITRVVTAVLFPGVG